ncbi:carboxymethylenebutenolidase [Mameliella alba]|uniref:dienelactone hydrolase family protein n=2 Tax=Mameliella alba TaxID=561184 RepID=UPI000882C85C|nr:dienelactone hydrolase family protein [Mameliella alba]OWV49434.1 dienelactone hydrolase family protein [Mameliella alba]PTR41393.1 carboxymethylenebutenolidase [Mameliella alba]SDC43830.1 carboxymethylenebutenolidase [Mameliella alba]BBU56248.1 carboxymethylenebutenolidase [Mameliella alba]GGF51096.1 carboxymethylenebutenolidase [Mameliella alba]
MMTQVTAGDGHVLDCWLAEAEGQRKGGIVVLQEIFGVTDQLKAVAARYAAQGYDVAVPALFDRQAKGMVIPFSEAPRGRDLMLASDPEQVMMDVEASIAMLAARGGKVAVIGFCWGGGLALRAAQVLPVACAVSFYGTRLDSYQTAPLVAPVQGHWGTEDSHVPPEMLEAARAYWPGMEVFTYEHAGHAFANEARPADHVPEAAELAHDRTAEFIARHV